MRRTFPTRKQKRRYLLQSLEDRRLLASDNQQIVNSLVPRLQTSELQSAALEIAPNGDSLVVFHGRDLTDNDGVFLRRFRANAEPTIDFRVNHTVTQQQHQPSLAIYEDGSYVVAWSGRGPGDQSGIFARWYNANDQPLTDDILINQITPGIQQEPDVAVDADGRTLFVWSGTSGTIDPDGIAARLFDDTGNPISDQVLVNTITAGQQHQPAITLNDEGRGVITWTSHHLEQNARRIAFQNFVLPTLDPSNPFDLSTVFTNPQSSTAEPTSAVRSQIDQTQSRVAIDREGRFVIVWAEYQPTDSQWDVFKQSFDAASIPVHSRNTLVNSQTGGTQRDPDIAMAADGRYVVSWTSGVENGSGWEVYAKTYSPGDHLAEYDFLVHETAGQNSGHQRFSAVAIGQGPAQIAWSGGGAIDRQGVWIRRSGQAQRPRITTIDPLVINEHSTLRFTIPVVRAFPEQLLRYDLDPFTHPEGVVIDPTTGMLIWTPNEQQGPGEFNVMVRVSDATDPTFFDTAVLPITVREVNAAPQLTVPARITLREGELLNFTPQAVDGDYPVNRLRFDLLQSPSTNTAINPLTGDVLWQTTEADGGREYPLTIRVSDDGVPPLSHTQTVLVQVDEVQQPPIIDPFPLFEIPERQPWQAVIQATDPDVGGNQGLTYVLSPSAVAAGLQISTTGIIRWTPTEVQGPGSYNFAVTVRDQEGLEASRPLQIVVTETNEPPLLEEIANLSVRVGSPLSVTAQASDPDRPLNELRYALDTASLQRGLTIATTTGRIDWQPTAAGIFPITITVTDNGIPSLSDSTTFSILVDQVQQPPIINPVPPQSIVELTQLQFTVTATPGSSGQQVRYRLASENPPGLVINPNTGIVRWTPTEAQGPASTFARIEAFASDNPSLFNRIEIPITVIEANLPPVLSLPEEIFLDEGSLLDIVATATDPDIPQNQLSFQFSSTFPIPGGMRLDPLSGRITWQTNESTGPAIVPIELIVSDNGSPMLEDRRTLHIHVRELNQPPRINDIEDQTIDEMTSFVLPISISDPDLPADTLRLTLDPESIARGMQLDNLNQLRWEPGEDAGPGSYPVTLTVSDDGVSPLSDSLTFTVHVREVNRPPSLQPLIDHAVQPGEQVTFTASASDPDIPVNQLRYSLRGAVPANSLIDPVTGQFEWTVPEDTEPTLFNFSVRVTDNGNPNLFVERPVSIEVLPRTLILIEEDRFVTGYEQRIELLPNIGRLQFRFDSLQFDRADTDSMNDAFEVALVDDQGRPLAAIISPDRDAFYNHSEDQTILLGGGTLATREGTTVTVSVDVSHLPAEMPLRLIQRLVNNDRDDRTQVVLFPGVQQLPHDGLARSSVTLVTPPPFAAIPRSDRLGKDVWRHLHDVTESVSLTYTHTAFDIDSDNVAAGVSIENTSPFALREPVLLVVSQLDHPQVAVTEHAGELPRHSSGLSPWLTTELQGMPYFNLSTLLSEADLRSGEALTAMLQFVNPTLDRFDYELHLLAGVNRPPQFVSSAPQTVRLGNVYRYPSQAQDPDADPLVYSIVVGPNTMQIDPQTGLIHWTPERTDVGSHRITIETVDPYGLVDQQIFVINVDDESIPNRAPLFITPPIVDAYVGQPYQYDALATDPDFDLLSYSVINGPSGLLIEAADRGPTSTTARVQWTPSAEFAGRLVPVTLFTEDGRGGTATQAYQIQVHANLNNLPPLFVTQPATTFQIPNLQTPPAVGDVSPLQIQEFLALDQTITHPVSVNLPPDVQLATADVVFVVDESGSMQEQSWIGDFITELDSELIAAGIAENRYAVVGFGSYTGAPRFVTEQDDYEAIVFGPDNSMVDHQIIRAGIMPQPIAFPADGDYRLAITRYRQLDSEPASASVAPGESLAFRYTADLLEPKSVARDGWGSYSGTLGDTIREISITMNAGDVFLVDGLNGAGVEWELVSPLDAVVIAKRALLEDIPPMIARHSGVYTLRLQGLAGTPYSFQILDPWADGITVDVGTVVNGQLTNPEQWNLYTFTADADSIWHLDRRGGSAAGLSLLPESALVDFFVIGPEGIVAEELFAYNESGALPDSNPEDLLRFQPTAGTSYTIAVRRSAIVAMDEPVPFSFQLFDYNDLIAGNLPTSPLTGTLTSPTASQTYAFDLQQGQRINATFMNLSGGPATWQFLDHDGLVITSGEMTIASGIPELTIRQAGIYYFQIAGHYDSDQATSYQVQFTSSSHSSEPYSGQAFPLNQPVAGSVVAGIPADYIVELHAGQVIYPALIQPRNETVGIELRTPTGGVLFSNNLTFELEPGLELGAPRKPPFRQLVVPETGTYLVRLTGSDTEQETLFQIATVEHLLATEQLTTGSVDASGSVEVYSFAANAGQTIQLWSLRPEEIFAGVTTTAERAMRLRADGSFEDGYLGLQFALDHLELRPHAAQHFILLTDEDRDALRPELTRDLIRDHFADQQPQLHVMANAKATSIPPSSSAPTLGFFAPDPNTSDAYQFFYPQPAGDFSTEVSSDYQFTQADGQTVEDYLTVVIDNGGTIWDIEQLRQPGEAGVSLRDSLSSAFTSTLTELVSRAVDVQLAPSISEAPLTIGLPSFAGSSVTFPVTFQGDGDAWNLALEFVDATEPGILYGSIPVALGGAYRYDFQAIDPESDAIAYTLLQGPTEALEFDEIEQRLFFAPRSPGSHTFALEAQDAFGGRDQQTWTLEVGFAPSDNAAPSIQPPLPIGIEVERPLALTIVANDPNDDLLTYRLIPDPETGALPPIGTTLDPATGQFTWIPQRTQIGIHRFGIQVSDGRGERDIAVLQIDVTPPKTHTNSSPQFISNPPTTAIAAVPYRYLPIVEDTDDDSLQYSLAWGPRGMVVDPSSGVLQWHPAVEQIGEHLVILRTLDGQGGIALQEFTLQVIDANTAPTFISSPPQLVALGNTWRYSLLVEDANGDIPELTLVPGANPIDATLDPITATIEWLPTTVGTHRFAILANDLRGGVTQHEFNVQVQPQTPPFIAATAPLRFVLGQEHAAQVPVFDWEPHMNNGSLGITIQWDNLLQSLGAEITTSTCDSDDHPCAAVVDIRWRPTQIGTFSLELTAIDPHGLSTTVTIPVHVSSPTTASTPPRFTSNPVGPAYIGFPWEYAVSALGENNQQVVIEPVGTLPPGAHWDATTRKLRWIPRTTQPQATFDFVATDSFGTTNRQSFSMTATDLAEPPAPRFISTPVTGSRAGTAWTYRAVTIDPAGTNVRYSLNAAAIAAGISLQEQTGELTWFPRTAAEVPVIVTATNQLNESASQSFTLQIGNRATAAPRIVTIPIGPAIVGEPWSYQIGAFDADGDPLQYRIVVEQPLDGLEIDERLGLVSFLPTRATTIEFTILVDDGFGAITTQPVQLQVIEQLYNPNPTKPTFTSVPQGPIVVGQQWQYHATAIQPGGGALTFRLNDTAMDAGIVIETATGKLHWNPTTTTTVPVILSVTNTAGQTTQQSFSLTPVVVNQPPLIMSLPTEPVVIDRPWQYAVIARDAEGDSLQYSLDAAALARGMTIDSAGVVRWLPTSTTSQRVTITVRDQATSITTQTLTLFPSEVIPPSDPAPRFRGIATSESPVNVAYRFQPLAFDPVADDRGDTTLQYTLLTAPDGMRIDSSSGEVRWLPTRIGTNSVSIQATSAAGLQSTYTYSLQIVPDRQANQPPQFLSTPVGPAVADLPYKYPLRAIDPEGAALTITLDQESQQRGMTIDRDHNLAWHSTTAGSFPVSLTVTDVWGASQQQTYHLVVLPNAPPRFTSAPPTLAAVGTTIEYQPVAVDPNPNDALSFSAIDLPAGAIVDASTGLLTWQPTTTGSFLFTLVVSDEDGASSEQAITLAVIDPSINHPPQIVDSPRSKLRFEMPWQYQVEAIDEDFEPVTFELSDGPSGMSLTSSGTLAWTPTADQITDTTAHLATIRAIDSRGATDEVTWEFFVRHTLENEPPLISANPAQSAVASRIYQTQFTAIDVDGDEVFWSIEQGPEGAAIDNRGLLLWNPTVEQIGEQTLVISAVDFTGAASQFEFTVQVRGANAPALIAGTPPSLHKVNTEYVYRFTASDADNDSVTFRFPAGVENHGAAIDPATGQFRWTPVAVGDYPFLVSAVDSLGDGTTLGFMVTVDLFGPNHPPQFDDINPGVAEAGSLYERQFLATDPDGDSITYSLAHAPSAMSVDAVGTLRWTAPANMIGQAVDIELVASDPAGLSARYYLRLPVRGPNQIPEFVSVPPTRASIGASYDYTPQTIDADGDSLTLTLAVAPPDAAFDSATGRLIWSTGGQTAGDYEFVLQLTDDRIAEPITQAWTLELVPDEEQPEVEIDLDPGEPEVNEAIVLSVFASDNVGVASLALTINDQPLLLDARGYARLTPTNPGRYIAVAIAMDAAGNEATARHEFIVRQPNDAAPSIVLLRPEQDELVTALTEVSGTVFDAEQQLTFIEVTLEAIDGRTPAKLLARHAAVDGDFLEDFVDTTLAMLDPSLLPNGNYRLIIEAEDAAFNRSRLTRELTIAGQLKLGSYSAAMIDMVIPLRGMPLTIRRSYNSLYASNLGDFGYGWNLETNDYRIKLPSDGLSGAGQGQYAAFEQGTRVLVSLPDATSVGFTFDPIPQNFSAGVPIDYLPYFRPDVGNPLELMAPAATLVRVDGRFHTIDGVPYHPADPEIGDRLTVQTADDLRYQIRVSNSQTELITDRNGNSLRFERDQIVSNTGLAVRFQRDHRDRIAAIIDPRGNRMTYAYDADDRLMAVTDRNQNLLPSDQQRSTTMQYDVDRPHLLVKVVDPTGVTIVDNQIDEQGRLVGQAPAAGLTISSDFDLEQRTQSVRFGDELVATRSFDSFGQLTNIVDPGGSTTELNYAPSGKPEAIIRNLHDDSTGERTEQFVYSMELNDAGQVVQRTSPAGNSSRYVLDPATGWLIAEIDPQGNRKTYSFDDRGNVLAIGDSQNQELRFVRDVFGSIVRASSVDLSAGSVGDCDDDPFAANQCFAEILLYEAEYDARGNEVLRVDQFGNQIVKAYDDNNLLIQETTTTPSANGFQNVRTFSLDANDQPILAETFRQDSTAATSRRRSTTRSFDAAGRLLSESTSVGEITSRHLNGAGLEVATSTVENSGQEVITYQVYDEAAKLIIQTPPVPRGQQPSIGKRYHYDTVGQITQTDTLIGLQLRILESDGVWSVQLVDQGHVLEGARAVPDAINHPGEIATGDNRSIHRARDYLGRTIETRTTVPNADGGSDERVILTAYDPFGRVLTATDPFDERATAPLSGIRYVYSTTDQPLRTDRVFGLKISIVTRPDGTLESVVDDPGLLIDNDRLQFDDAGRLSKRMESDGAELRFAYDPAGRQTVRRRIPSQGSAAETVQVTIEEERDDELQSTIFVDNTTEAVLRNEGAGAQRLVKDGQGRTVATEIIQGLKAAIVPVAGGRVRIDLLDPGTIVASSTTEYDSRGRIVHSRNLLGGERDYQFDELGNTIAVISEAYFDIALGQFVRPQTEFLYNGNHRIAETSGIRVLADGSQDRSLARTTTYGLDNQGRLTSTLLPDGTQTFIEYDAQGRQAAIVNTAGYRTRYEYNAESSLVAVIQPLVTDVNGRDYYPRTEFEYDSWGNRIITRSNLFQLPDGTIDRSEARAVRDHFDSANRLSAVTRGEETEEQRFYDLAGRIDQILRSDGSVEAFRWRQDTLDPGLERTEYFASIADFHANNPADFTRNDRLSNTMSLQQFAGGEIRRERDQSGRLIRVTTPTGILSYEYDRFGNHSATQSVDRNTNQVINRIEYSYNAANRLDKIAQTIRNGTTLSSEIAYQYHYNVFGQVHQILHPDGIIEHYQYDAIGRTTSITYMVADNTPLNFEDDRRLAQYQASFDLAGHREHIIEQIWDDDSGNALSHREIILDHDAADRLIRHEVISDGLHTETTYAYDSAHNRVRMDVDLDGDSRVEQTTRYAFDSRNRLIEENVFVGGFATIVTTHDYADGSLDITSSITRDAATDQVLREIHYEYDLRGYLQAVESLEFGSSERRIRSEYDRSPDGTLLEQRNWEWEAGEEIHAESLRMLVDELSPTGSRQIFEAYTVDSTEVARSFIGGHRILAEVEDDAWLSTLVDTVGSIRGTRELASGEVTRYAYGAFGESAEERRTKHGYAGQWHETTTGLVDLRQRTYSPGLGRFLQADSFSGLALEPSSLNRYIYAANAPFTFHDPSGNLFVLIDGTWNHDSPEHLEEGEDFTNVLKLRDAYDRQNEVPSLYSRGVGNPVDNGTISGALGGGFGRGLTKIVENVLDRTIVQLADSNDDVFLTGFSRGTIAALQFTHELFRARPEIRIKQMAIYDPVGSVGFPGNGVNIGFNLSLAPNVVAANNLISWQEDRGFFPGTNLISRNARQVVTFGVHSDVGGGYGTPPFGMIQDSLAHFREIFVAEGLAMTPVGVRCPLCGEADTHYPHSFKTYATQGGQTFPKLGRPMVEHPMPGELGLSFFAEDMDLRRVGATRDEVEAAQFLWIPFRVLQIASFSSTIARAPLVGGIVSPLYTAWNLAALHASYIYYWVNRI